MTEELSELMTIEPQMTPPPIPEQWDFEQSVNEVKPLIPRWKELTFEIATKLYVAREKLSQSGLRTDLGTNIPRLPPWSEYCEAIGLEKRTANRWLAATFGNVRLSPPPLPKQESQVLYADPPWAFNNTGFNQSAAQQYPTLSIDGICNYQDETGKKVRQLAKEKESVLFLWVPEALTPEGLQVMKAWGFDYKAQLVWKKDRAPGIGWWVNSKHEQLFIGARGTELHPATKYDSVFEAPVTEQSRKPEIVYKMIEAMYSGPYIELFARNKPPEKRRPNWEYWGNEA